jgi:hypothetical protein
MPQIFDNIEKQLLTALSDALGLSERADFCYSMGLRNGIISDSSPERQP